jgi:glycosyltransferase involved in cell wall biosynthesis
MQFHILSFEGPDPYARAGGIASRIEGLSGTLADFGFDTHLWFVGDPGLPGHESRGPLTLHRWCQWISRFHPGGVYDGEEGKRADYAASLPPFLLREVLAPALGQDDDPVVVMAEEWQTVDAVLHLDHLLRRGGLRDRVRLLWNANNVFGFDRIDWTRLARAATITTVSRYMRQRMWALGVDPLVVPNGIPQDILIPPDRGAVARLRRVVADRTLVTKIARWDPDKRWLLAVDSIRELKRDGRRPLLVARGGMEAHGAEVLARAAAAGLRVVERDASCQGSAALLEGLRAVGEADIAVLKWRLCPEEKRTLFRTSSAVLVNSGHEPFGLVGLEAMAAGGVACVGGTGEDYAIGGWNALVLQTCDPRELGMLLRWLRSNPREEDRIRRRASATARSWTWPNVIGRNLLPAIRLHSEARAEAHVRWDSNPQRGSAGARPAARPHRAGVGGEMASRPRVVTRTSVERRVAPAGGVSVTRVNAEDPEDSGSVA